MDFVVFVALVNVLLGFAVAVVLGRRYRALTAPAPGSAFDDWPLSVETFPHDMGAAEAAPVGTFMPPEAPARAPHAPAAPSPSPSREPSLPAEVIADLRRHASQYAERLNDTDQKLRVSASAPDAAEIEACLRSLRAATDEYLASRADQDGFEDLVGASGEAAASGEACEACDRFQTAARLEQEQIAHARQRFDAFDPGGDLPACCGELVVETSRLVDANHRLRDALEEVDLYARPADDRFDEGAECFEEDSLTGVLTRAGLESALTRLWRQDPHRVRHLCAAMIDVDQFAALNQAHGYRVGDDLLRALGKVLRADRRDEIVVGRFAGQRFCLLFPDTDLRLATSIIERLRQSLELTHFLHHKGDLRLTVSCSITESGRDDTSASLFERAESALREAKRYGRNRTFLHEGKYPAPVIPPTFSLQEREIVI